MIIFEISEVFVEARRRYGISRLCEVTGLNQSTIYNIINGCNFTLNEKLVAALSAIGYEISITKK